MSVETMQLLSTIFFISAVVFFLLSIILFFALKVPKLFKELTGIAANQGIKSIDFGANKTESGVLHTGRKKLSGIMTLSGNLKDPSAEDESKTGETRKLKTNKLKEDSSPQTTALISNENTVPTGGKKSADDTLPVVDANKQFKVIFELSYMSSSEIIE